MNKNQSYTHRIGNKELIISQEEISWARTLVKSSIKKPVEIRYGTSAIEFDMFSIGTKYRIDLKDHEGNSFNISIKSYFGIGRRKKFDTYQKIVDSIWHNFFEERFNRIISEWEEGQTHQIGRFELNVDGLIRKSKRNKGKEVVMTFDEIELLPRFDHLLINSKYQSNKYIRLYYLEE